MEQRPLFRGGPPVSAIGLGAWPFGGGMGAVEEREAIATVHAALDHGVTFIDTAEMYRSSETVIGKALAGGRRAQAFLATKASGNFTAEHIREAMENSLRALQTDAVDLYQVHWWEGRVPIEESMAAMEALRQEGKTRYLGVSNFNVPQMEAAGAAAPFQTLQPRYNLIDREIEAEIAPYCEQEGIGILVHSPLGKGLLTGSYRPGHTFAPDDERSRNPRFQGDVFRQTLAKAERLRREVAEPRGLTMVQLAIGWTLRLPAVSVCLVGAKSPRQVEQQLGGQGWRLTDEELARVDEILQDAG